jgi:hypothetical protein
MASRPNAHDEHRRNFEEASLRSVLDEHVGKANPEQAAIDGLRRLIAAFEHWTASSVPPSKRFTENLPSWSRECWNLPTDATWHVVANLDAVKEPCELIADLEGWALRESAGMHSSLGVPRDDDELLRAARRLEVPPPPHASPGRRQVDRPWVVDALLPALRRKTLCEAYEWFAWAIADARDELLEQTGRDIWKLSERSTESATPVYLGNSIIRIGDEQFALPSLRPTEVLEAMLDAGRPLKKGELAKAAGIEHAFRSLSTLEEFKGGILKPFIHRPGGPSAPRTGYWTTILDGRDQAAR